jgi:PrsW family intramembrane metalloprotease
LSHSHRNDEPTQPPSPTGTTLTSHRGFATGISDFFVQDSYERVDCCAVTCCGILQHDRDRYLVTGLRPPSMGKRLVMHIFVPITLFFAAGVWALRVTDVFLNELGCISLLLLLVVYFVMQCAKGRAKRIALRKDILYTKYKLLQPQACNGLTVHETTAITSSANATAATLSYQSLAVAMEDDRPVDEEDDDSNDCICCVWPGRSTTLERDYYLGQTRSDFRSAHGCCGISCYRNDRIAAMEHYPRDTRDIMTCLGDIFRRPLCFGYHVQLCGLCALAQEAREIEQCILPPAYRRIDYITMESMLQYYPAIYHHRHYGNNRNHNLDSVPPTVAAEYASMEDGTLPRSVEVAPPPLPAPRLSLIGQPLSRLSYRLVQSLGLFWMIMLLWSVLGTYYWTALLGRRGRPNHQFLLADWMILTGTFISSFGLLYLWSWMVHRHQTSGLSLDAVIKYFASGFFLSASLALFWELAAAMTINAVTTLVLAILGIDRMDSPRSDSTKQSGTLFLLSELPGFAVHALSGQYKSLVGDCEPWTVSATRTDFATVFGLDHPVWYAVYIFVATFFVAGFIEELCKYFGFRMVEHPDFLSRQELEEVASIMHRNVQDNDTGEHEGWSRRDTQRSPDFSKHDQSIQSRGAAITLAMVSVAIGFACCENLVYIFLYSADSVELELAVLLERSFFPIHPILAAIQSIGVCQRELEGSRATKLGRIILPAVLFHGMFDFCLIYIGFVGKVVGRGVEEGDLRISNATEFWSIVCCVWVMFSAIAYLYHESGKQRERLAAIDLQFAVDRSNLS